MNRTGFRANQFHRSAGGVLFGPLLGIRVPLSSEAARVHSRGEFPRNRAAQSEGRVETHFQRQAPYSRLVCSEIFPGPDGAMFERQQLRLFPPSDFIFP